jgi:hypothetical protein
VDCPFGYQSYTVTMVFLIIYHIPHSIHQVKKKHGTRKSMTQCFREYFLKVLFYLKKYFLNFNFFISTSKEFKNINILKKYIKTHFQTLLPNHAIQPQHPAYTYELFLSKASQLLRVKSIP